MTRDEHPRSEATEGVNGLRSPAFGAILTLGVLVALPYVVPSLTRFRLFEPLPDGASLLSVPAAPAASATVGETALDTETAPTPELAEPEDGHLAASAASALPAGARDPDRAPRPLEDPTGHAFDGFFRALGRVERKEPGSIARISYFGDSIVASDFVTATLRRGLQRRYGDAGHGFVLVANAWPGYFHNDVTRFASKGWQMSRVVGPYAEDGFYGLGGVSFRSQGAGVFSRIGTAESGTFGRNVSRFVVSYLEQPNGGPLELRIDGALRELVDTSAPVAKSAFRTYEVPDGPHTIEVRANGPNVRTFGVTMERDSPGVVLDAIGIQGCRMRFLDKSDDAHFAEQLRARAPNLVVFQYGMNESEDGELFPLDQYESTLRDVLRQVRAAIPESSCLLVGPMDRADKKGDVYKSRPVIPKLTAIQRKVAAEVGCGFWDTFDAMGGTGSMGTWQERGLGGADLAHPSSAGAELLARWIQAALLDGYEASAARRGP